MIHFRLKSCTLALESIQFRSNGYQLLLFCPEFGGLRTQGFYVSKQSCLLVSERWDLTLKVNQLDAELIPLSYPHRIQLLA